MAYFRILSLVFSAVLWSLGDAYIDWCDLLDCSTSHIACNSDGKFDPSCENPSQIKMTSDLKDQILSVHNTLRNKIALGREPRFKSAKRMAQMVWSRELAWLAELNTKQCKMQHDECRSTVVHEYAGQNLGEMGTSGEHYKPSEVVDEMINSWYDENQYALQSDVKLFTRLRGQGGKVIGHFTTLVGERQTEVGCAMSRYTHQGFNMTLIACNYASTNLLQQPVYRSGAPASGCVLGSDSEYKGLCKTIEPINSNILSIL